jgi:hypothetical protein
MWFMLEHIALLKISFSMKLPLITVYRNIVVGQHLEMQINFF